jgi:hypothetical protein
MIFAFSTTCSYAKVTLRGILSLQGFARTPSHNYHLSIFATFAVANMQTRRSFAAANVRDLDGNRFTHAQTTMVHQSEDGAKARFAHRTQQGLDFGASQNDGQHFGFGDAHFLEHSLAGDLDAIQIEGQQRVLGCLHGSGLVVLVLAQEQEVLAQLVFGERGRVALEVLGQLADIADVFLFGGRPVVFEFDKLLEL